MQLNMRPRAFFCLNRTSLGHRVAEPRRLPTAALKLRSAAPDLVFDAGTERATGQDNSCGVRFSNFPPGAAVSSIRRPALTNLPATRILHKQTASRGMDRMSGQYKSAEAFKLDGNAAFKEGKFAKAITAYTQAITKSNGRVATYFTNRALARTKSYKDSDDLEAAVDDCLRALALSEKQDATAMKAHYYMGLAQLELGRPNESYTSLAKGYKIAIREKSASIMDIRDMLMEARKQRWQRSEKKRLEEEGALAQRLKTLIESERHWRLQTVGDDEGRIEEANENADENLRNLDNLLQRSDERFRVREVPDYFVCPISLSIFSDPVITPSGRSYERASILQHLKHNPFDPLTREPLIASKIFDNLGLRDACEDFLKHNGWAVEY